MTSPAPTDRSGRSLGWRLATAAAGLALGGAGVATILCPRLLGYVVGGALALLGLVLLVSALAARGRG